MNSMVIKDLKKIIYAVIMTEKEIKIVAKFENGKQIKYFWDNLLIM